MEKRSYIRTVVWGMICLAGSGVAYSLGWQQGVDAGQQRAYMQSEIGRAYRSADLDDEMDDATPAPTEKVKRPQRHNASSPRDEHR